MTSRIIATIRDFIQQVRLPNGRRTTNLGFGCASLMRLPGARQRDRLIKTALELGLTHFDVARMYGLGAAEGVVGRAVAAVRDQVTLATKFGLPSSVPGPFRIRAQSAARWVLALHPGIKKRVTRAVAGAAQDESRAHRCDYSVEEMRRSLRTSLGQLKTGQVDLFFLHEPSVRDAIPAGLGEALEAERQSGRIGAFGVSAWARDLPGLLQSRPELAGQARQYDHSVFDAEPALSSGAGGSFTGFFSVIRRAHGPMLECLDTDRNFAREWSGRLNLDLLQPEQAGIVILSLALLLNPQGLVLFSSTRPERLRAVVGGLRASSLEPEQLLEFRKAVSARMVNSHAR